MGSGIWPWPQPQLRAGCLKPSTCKRWPLRERMSPAQSCCPARLQKLELQIHNSSGTPWLFVSCCEQMEELQIKPSAAREPIAFPTQPRRQQQRQGGGRGRKKKKKRQKAREKESAISTGAELPSQHTYVQETGTLCWQRALPGELEEGSALPPPVDAWLRKAARVGGDIGKASAATHWESRLLTLIRAGSACTRFGPRGGIKGEKLTSVVERTRSPLIQGSRQHLWGVANTTLKEKIK